MANLRRSAWRLASARATRALLQRPSMRRSIYSQSKRANLTATAAPKRRSHDAQQRPHSNLLTATSSQQPSSQKPHHSIVCPSCISWPRSYSSVEATINSKLLTAAFQPLFTAIPSQQGSSQYSQQFPYSCVRATIHSSLLTFEPLFTALSAATSFTRRPRDGFPQKKSRRSQSAPKNSASLLGASGGRGAEQHTRGQLRLLPWRREGERRLTHTQTDYKTRRASELRCDLARVAGRMARLSEWPHVAAGKLKENSLRHASERLRAAGGAWATYVRCDLKCLRAVTSTRCRSVLYVAQVSCGFGQEDVGRQRNEPLRRIAMSKHPEPTCLGTSITRTCTSCEATDIINHSINLPIKQSSTMSCEATMAARVAAAKMQGRGEAHGVVRAAMLRKRGREVMQRHGFHREQRDLTRGAG